MKLKCIFANRFPLEFVAFQRWITAIKEGNNQIVFVNRATARVCCEHFYPTDIFMEGGKMAIRPTAVPKLFPLSRFLLQKLSQNFSMTYRKVLFLFLDCKQLHLVRLHLKSAVKRQILNLCRL